MSAVTQSQASKAAIVIGASKFEKSPGLNRAGFYESASDFIAYLLDEKLFALPSRNLLNLFDSKLSPGDHLETICDFLEGYLRQAPGDTNDIVIFYVGHGGFVGLNAEYFLTIATTKEGLEGSSSIRIGDFSSALRDHAKRARKYLILDCCFAASAFSQFQSPSLSDIISAQTLEPLPRTGTALLCSSGPRQVSLALPGQTHTMFSGALMQVLRNGESSGQAAFSLQQVGSRVEDILRQKYAPDWIRPEVHSPDMSEGDIACVPVFPNPRFNPKQRPVPIREYVQELELLLEERTKQLVRMTTNLERSYDITLETLGDAMDLRNIEDEGHCSRVTAYTIAIARAMGLDHAEISQIARGAFLHDFGYISLPDALLRRPDALTADEVTLMRQHCYQGYRALKKIPFLAEAAEIVYSHHERYDGTGYPRGLKGSDIPLGARILSVADTLEAVTTVRPYRRAQTVTAARDEIQRWSDKQFDPEVVKIFASMPEEIWRDLRAEMASKTYRLGLGPLKSASRELA
jgi:hypothetical protein